MHAILLALLFLADTPEPPRAAPVVPQRADITGYYSVAGKTPGDDKPYEGVAVIVKKSEVYLVVWTLGAGQSIAGIGTRSGDSFSVGWYLPLPDGVARGVNTYTVHPDGRLVGRWASMPGPGRIGSETLEFLRAYVPPEESDP